MSLVTPPEARELNRILSGEKMVVSIPRYLGAIWRTWLMFAAWAVAMAAFLAVAVFAPPGVPGGPLRAAFAFAMVVVMFGGAVSTFVRWFRDDQALRHSVASHYLDTIGYKSRTTSEPAPSPETDYDDRPWYPTGHYDPERWFSYSHGAREYMRQTGMDADTYDSNVA